MCWKQKLSTNFSFECGVSDETWGTCFYLFGTFNARKFMKLSIKFVQTVTRKTKNSSFWPAGFS